MDEIPELQSVNQLHKAPLTPVFVFGFILLIIGGVFIVSAKLQKTALYSQSHAATQSPATANYSFGTLMTDPAHSQEEAGAGVDTAMMEFGWNNYEPQDGSFSSSYIAQLQQNIQTYHASGQQITLAFGAHYTPSWVFNYANSSFVNQYGVPSGEANIVYNQTLRTKMQEYMQNIVNNLGINNFTTIRINAGGDAEALLPAMTDSQNHTNSYWAYDANAQNGTNLPPTLTRSPYPGWHPGDTTYNGQPFTTAQVEQWYAWYIKSLDDVVNWQIQFFKNAGFTGKFQVLTPGQGARPSQYTQAINAYLNGMGDGAHVMGRGAAWDKFYSYLPDKQNVIAYVSSMADGSGNNDLCQSTDDTVNIDDPQIFNWSATRWISYIADRNNLQKSGENPGRSDTNGYGVQMMNTTGAQMNACHFLGMYWAHDFNLYDGVSGVTLNDYHNVITQYNGSVTATPTPQTTLYPTPTSTPVPTPTIIDTTPPTVSISTPLNGQIVPRNSTIPFNAIASDNVQVTKVNFYVNNQLRCSDTTSPYTCTFGTSGKPNAVYTLKATAYDEVNNYSNANATVTTSR